MNRRQFLQHSLGATATTFGAANVLAANAMAGNVVATNVVTAKAQTGAPVPNALPRWRGFNLLEKFVAERQAAYNVRDFRWMARWGFDFVRLPMSYRCWTGPGWTAGDPTTWTQLDEARLREVDRAVDYGRQHGIHVNLNLHRIPGYCVNPPAEPLDLWTDDRALEAAVFHWRHLAERYRGLPNERVSFDLINEPANVDEARYVRVIRALVEGIRSVDPGRLIIADGLQYGTIPVFGLADLKLGQSTRGYNPMPISHYRASWVKGSDTWPEPTWPLQSNGTTWDAALLRSRFIQPWQQLQARGVGIHVGEWGVFNKTPHAVALAWMEDNLRLWQEAGWGWSLWNLRGAFGILNSERNDVPYERYRGQQLDRAMLELLRRY